MLVCNPFTIHFFSNSDRQEYCQQQFTHAHFLAAQAEFSSLFRHKFMSGKHNFFKSIPYICSEQHYGTLKRCLANEIVFKQQPSLFNAWVFFFRFLSRTPNSHFSTTSCPKVFSSVKKKPCKLFALELSL